ncbi:uncharacterized protein PGTG_20815 [Puccinia graminis f. sp. tritici CRL 75-36-700-3]|uniref:DDE Tnp4 domain-containing protein n=1 Tax=Puccinia graminis f. sp. tritici (strain CRL 75-36-700-3 / race SCCL) TaxID=418459 RepID=H6QPR5_PUCGT|nr:uncharacterized protein PGTG_20815 [Puccinia graminis f. sp. tritici CRL 75-36-700-3]EHS64115.1 hypothetical protein PGTG_20815 [Puccinia graminis f. sp. tritici CRL 75-36-700-3]
MLPPPIDPTTLNQIAALWMWNRHQQALDQQIYVRADRTAFVRPERWEPWNDDRLPLVRFIEYFRMSRADFAWLSDELRETLQQDPLRRGAPLSVEAQVAVGLYRLGHGATYVMISHVFNIGKETADKATGHFVQAVLKVLRLQTISFPGLDAHDKWDEIIELFEWRHGIPDIVGAIDGTHIPLAIPPSDEWKGYINRKNWASLVFQCVVNGDGNFRDVCDPPLHNSYIQSTSSQLLHALMSDERVWTVGQVFGGGAGSIHDTRVFRRSDLGISLNNALGREMRIPPGTHLIGDAGYPSDVNVLVPYPSVVAPENVHFNHIQSATRIIVEQTFGRLKNRFRILLTAQKANPVRARNTAFVCMILHNLLNKRGTLYLQGWDERSRHELRFGELPRLNEHDQTPPPPGESMWTRRDRIRDMYRR